VLPLDEELLAILRPHWQNQVEEQRLEGEAWNAERRVSCTERGTLLSARNMQRHYKEMLKRAGLPKTMRFHDLRHSAGGLMLDRGAQLVRVSKILRHSSPMVTASIYAHAFQESEARAIEDLSRALRRRKA
jgi:integrase